MIKRIISVNDFRCYQGWRHRHKDATFERLNLVYAPNGTGKSTFAELLSGVPRDKSWSHGMRALIQTGDDPSQSEEVDGAGHWIWDDVRLFNAEYVQRNLRFDARDGDGDSDGADAPALLHMGEKNIELQENKERSQQEIDRLTPLLQGLRQEQASAVREAGKLCSNLARQVNNTLRGKAPHFSKQFDKRHVERALAEPSPTWSELRAVYDQDQALLNTSSSEQVPPVDLGHVPTEELLAQAALLLGRTVSSEVLSALEERPEHEAWVRQGLGLHGDRDICVFCESGISPHRRAALDRHFDEGYTRLLADLDESLGRIQRIRTQVNGYSGSLPHPAELFEDLREEYSEESKRVDASITTVLGFLDEITEALERKKRAMFDLLAPPPDLVPPRIDTTTVNEIIGEHNERTERLESDRAKAAERQFQRMLQEVRQTWSQYLGKAAELDDRIQSAEEELTAHIHTVRTTPDEGLDPHYLVHSLNRDVNDLLRRAELAFDYRDDRYHLLRHGAPAQNLSEGEKTAIAMVYFLTSLKEGGRELGRTVVVVDDPVSSLDEQLMTGVRSMLASQLTPLNPKRGCRQLFILTHSAAFLRKWRKQLDRGRGNPDKALLPTATLHIMKSVRVGSTSGAGSRRPELVPVDLQSKAISALDTEYSLLFYRVAHDLLEAKCSVQVEGDLRLVAESPNSVRQLLEHFLGFTHPNQAGKFANVVDHALPEQPVRAERIKDLLNDNSHRSADPGGKEPLSEEAQGTITDVFRLINELNPKHFEGMCSSLGITKHQAPLLLD